MEYAHLYPWSRLLCLQSFPSRGYSQFSSTRGNTASRTLRAPSRNSSLWDRIPSSLIGEPHLEDAIGEKISTRLNTWVISNGYTQIRRPLPGQDNDSGEGVRTMTESKKKKKKEKFDRRCRTHSKTPRVPNLSFTFFDRKENPFTWSQLS